MEKKNVENKIEELKDELKENNTEAIVVESESKVRKYVTYALKGLALLATGAVGFLLGRGIGNGKDDEEDHNETTEE